MVKLSNTESFRCFRVQLKIAFVLGCRFFITRTLRARAITVSEMDVGEGSVAIWVGPKVIKIYAEKIFRIV